LVTPFRLKLLQMYTSGKALTVSLPCIVSSF
jgi:hypothetical protein